MYRLDKGRFDEFIRLLGREYRTYAPVRTAGRTGFAIVDSAGMIDTDVLVTDMSPKEIFFPPSETLFRYGRNGIKTDEVPERPIAVWGIRSCDVRSLSMLDRVFGSAVQMPEDDRFKDPYWNHRYGSSLLFGSACIDPSPTCFCNWFGGGPFNKDGMDVFTVDAGEYYLLEPVSGKGQEFIGGLACLAPAGESELDLVSAIAAEAASRMPEEEDLKEAGRKLSDIFDEPVWSELSAKCVNCGACTFCCPTCHCFDIQDESRGSEGRRVRIWDSCMFPIFTREASGHNPRALSKERVRQRIMHKYSYSLENYGEFLCTGCGRCVLVCPVNLDIRDVLRRLLHYRAEGKCNG
ncbi:MAG: 4Fe-4S dicluster domain-containing protein [Candidatus Fermentibacteraceae bacterium]|nr:4Fe-4S dicluster domain-containing protein [Candidatus Fermentibacteraceae bacterium]